MPLPPMTVNPSPVLLADAAELLPAAVKAPAKKAERVGDVVLASALTGVVSVGRVRSELLELPSLPAVDVIAGTVETALPAVDAIAGLMPRSVSVEPSPVDVADVGVAAGTS